MVTRDGAHESDGFIIGLDLGQAQDYMATAIVERVVPPLPKPIQLYQPLTYDGGGETFNTNDDRMLGVAIVSLPPEDTRQATYHVRHLERPALGTKDPTIVARVKTLLASPPLTPRTPLVIDRTGVGRPVTDLFEGEGVRPYAITITGGDEVLKDGAHHTKVPKRELVSTLVAVFQTERLKIAAGLTEGPVLANELTNFKVRVNLATGNDSYEAWRESVHDDLVLAVALAVWHGEHKPEPIRFYHG